MKLKCLASGSKGNCYILTDDSTSKSLILDAGISWKRIQKGLNYTIVNVDGCLISHAHSDHVLSANDIEKCGIPVFRPYESFQPSRRFGEWLAYPFSLPHDGVPCFGFYVRNGDFGILYLTDFEYCQYTFKSKAVNTIIIECNHMDDVEMDENSPNYNHVFMGHSSLSTACGFIKANQTEYLKSVVLVHLSESNADKNKMIETVKDVVGDGVNVYAVTGTTEIEI